MTALELTGATGEVVEVAKGISEYGFMVIAASVFVVVSILQQIVMNRRYEQTQKNNEDRYNKLFEQVIGKYNDQTLIDRINSLVNSVEALLTPIGVLLNTMEHESREECTEDQALKHLKNEMELLKIRFYKAVRGVVERNNVHANEKATSERLERIIINLYKNSQTSASSFKYKGNRLGDIYMSDLPYKLHPVALEYILSEERNEERFKSDCDLIFDVALSGTLERVSSK